MGKPEEQIHLIVDGFNVAHAWGWVKRRSGGWISEIQNALQEELKEIHDERGWKVTIVMDGKGKDMDRQIPLGDDSFTVLFAPSSLTADAVIEQMVSADGCPGTIRVATEDRSIAHSIEASGAETVSPAALRVEVGTAKRLKGSRLKNNTDESENAFENRIPL